MLYFWLKKGFAEEKIKDLQKQGLLGEKLKVETDQELGRKHIPLYEDPFNPATDLPEIPEELIEKVTVKDYRIYRGFRTEGIYRHEGATLMLKTFSEVHGSFMGDHVERDDHQSISISAPSVKALKAIYTIVRQGKLEPEEDWEQDIDVPDTDTPPAEETA
ncbi:MAG: hypothetical protein A2V60_02085 [Candidatus Portnoybacteria bacterium RIFCSPHIGHO2_01_FULL_39_19]|nr:MAG: hypothetical protein A2V60_02085 [Candidatus Portnoybacteria bacterium RIFCSPHIGHO2_01_FULL_39_19]